MRPRRSRAVLAIACGLLAGAAACLDGGPPGLHHAAVDGGDIWQAEGATVQIPTGALSQSLPITVARIDPPVDAPLPASAAGGVYEFQPHGTKFAIPVSISIPYQSDASPDQLTVVRLPGKHPGATGADVEEQVWAPIGGVHFEGGLATFETTTFSDYVVVGAGCSSVSLGLHGGPHPTTVSCNPGTCATGQTCCSHTCVPLDGDPTNCGACARACDPNATYCGGATGHHACVTLHGVDALCGNRNLTVVGGELPPLNVVAAAQTTDGASAATLSSALQTYCASKGAAFTNVTSASQATLGLLDPCTDAPLLQAGNTVLVTGGGFAQRVARFTDRNVLSWVRQVDNGNGTSSFLGRAGAVLHTWPNSGGLGINPHLRGIGPTHDFFVVEMVPEPMHGGLVLEVYGIGWEGTPAAVWYVQNQLLTRQVLFDRYVVVEWIGASGVKSPNDSWTLLAKDDVVY